MVVYGQNNSSPRRHRENSKAQSHSIRNNPLVQVKRVKIWGIRFRRQQTIGNYIVDFVCLEKHLIVEVDGGQHNESPAITLDKQRTNWLESQGYCLLRFWNNDISSNIDGVISKILENAG